MATQPAFPSAERHKVSPPMSPNEVAHARDLELERIASNNPAMTVPAASRLVFHKKRRHVRPPDKLRKAQQRKPHHHSNTEDVVTDPAGDIETISTNASDSANSDDYETVSKYDRGWRRVVRNFSPSWFSTTMGTGIVSILLAAIPWQSRWLYWLSAIFFALNAVIFALAFGISTVRYTVYPEIWVVMINDPTNSLFLGTAAMGFSTLIESWVTLCCPYWGNWSVTFAWVLWIVDSVVSFAVTVSLPFLLMSSSHQQSLDRITAAQLLPIATTIVASGAGARVAEALNRFNPEYALGTAICSYVMWAMSTPFALTILVVYYQRLALHKLPPREIIVSSFLPLGPLGMGGYTIMYLGKVMREVLPGVGFLQHIPTAGDFFYLIGMFIALMMWGFGAVWGLFALATIYKSPTFPFNMGWWGFTFPLGVFAVSTITFGVEMPSLFFRVLGTIFAVMVMMLWVVVAAGTIKGARSGKLFYAPCLKNLPPEKVKPGRELSDVEKSPQTQ